jgi:hypothetical protein
VLDVTRLRSRILSTGTLRAANFAIEMVESAGKFQFKLGTP